MQICNVVNSNSADNTDLVAFFEGTDSDENMRLIFSKYTEVLKKMQEPGYQLDLGEFGLKYCRIFLSGDYEFLCKVLGHMGANSTCPCLWCHVKLEKLRNPGGQPHCPKIKNAQGNWVDRDDWPTDRTVEDMQRDIQDNIRESGQAIAKLKANSKKFHSLYAEPILPIICSIEHIVPPFLHIMLGLVQRFFNMLELVCKSIDDDGDFEGRDTDGKWREASENTQNLELILEQKQHDLEWDEVILEGFRKANQGEENGGADDGKPCDMPVCAMACVNPWTRTNITNRGAARVRWFQCSNCGDGVGGTEGWYHLSCVGLGEQEYGDPNFEFICPVCEGEVNGAGDVIRNQVQKIKEKKKLVKKAKDDYNKQKQELDRVYEQVRETMGPKERELNEVLENQLKVKRQAYHSQCFVGNHCRIILEKYEALVNVISGHDKHDMYHLLFSKLCGILLPYSHSNFLTQEEVDTLVDRCYDFGVWFPTNFVDQTIPPKFHMIVCALPKCAQTWYATGLLSEHGLEAKHALCNADERTYIRMRNNECRLDLIFKQNGRYARVDKASLRVIRRRCQVKCCKGRFITIDKIRQCNLCYEDN